MRQVYIVEVDTNYNDNSKMLQQLQRQQRLYAVLYIYQNEPGSLDVSLKMTNFKKLKLKDIKLVDN